MYSVFMLVCPVIAHTVAAFDLPTHEKNGYQFRFSSSILKVFWGRGADGDIAYCIDVGIKKFYYSNVKFIPGSQNEAALS